MGGKIYAGILVNRVGRVPEGLIDYAQGGFRSGRGCADQLIILKEIGGKHLRKK